MKVSSIHRGGLFGKGPDISSSRSLVEKDLNKVFQVTAECTVTLGTPSGLKALLGDRVAFYSSLTNASVIAAGAGASVLNHSGNIPLGPGLVIVLTAFSSTSWVLEVAVPATAADIAAGTDVKKFLNSKEHLTFHAADIAKLAAIGSASESAEGLVQFASEAATILGESSALATHPAGVAAAIAAAVSSVAGAAYVAGSVALTALVEERQTGRSSFGEILPAGYPPNEVPIFMNGQIGLVGDDTYKEAYFFVADKPGEATFAVDLKKGGSNAGLRWCKNGVALESEITHSSTTYATYTKTISFNVGDCISAQTRDTSDSSYAYTKNFKVLVG